MKFSIITPTFKRKDLLLRAVDSLTSQTYKDWELIIINDSPSDVSYLSFATTINDPRIHYHVNPINKGVNYSRNYALDHVSADSKWVIFLDDDDYLSPDTLQTFHDLILLNGNEKWFVTNRALTNGKPLTLFPHSDTTYNYAWSYLILKRLKGDATHCIETKCITHNKIRFSKYVKQAEEWFFFYQVGLLAKMFYHDHNSTVTDGYNTTSGLNLRKRIKGEVFETLIKISAEGVKIGLWKKPSFIFYIFIRSVLLILR